MLLCAQSEVKFLLCGQSKDDATYADVSHRVPDSKTSKHKDIGKRLKWAREHAEMTIRDVAARAGVASSAVTEIEQGARIPKADTLERLAAALKVAPCWLVFGEGAGPEGYDTV